MSNSESAVDRVLRGSIDLHCHSGPSPFPRRFDHAEAALDAERIGMRAILVKSHHHSTVMDVLAMSERLKTSRTEVFGGIALNSQVGGINPYAVEMALRMGGKAVWFPTFSSGRHIDCHPEGDGFPESTVELSSARVEVLDDSGELIPAALRVLDLILESEAILNGGHLDPTAISVLFTEGQRRGIRRMVLSHPDFVIGAAPEQCLDLTRLGAFIEHEVGMYDPEGYRKWDPKQLLNWIETIGPEHTVFGSDLGQRNRPAPADAYRRVATALLDLGLAESDLQTIIRDNPAYLLNVPR